MGESFQTLRYSNIFRMYSDIYRERMIKTRSQNLFLFIPIFYLQTVQMQVHLANGVMGGEARRGAPISTPL
jgi:hypothetical protein